MNSPKIQFFVGEPLGDLFSFNLALDGGVLEPPTNKTFVIADEFGNSVVFHGDFTISRGVVVGGTVTGFDVFAGSTKLFKASGYELDGTAVFAAVQNYDKEPRAFYDIIVGVANKQIGSKFGDMLDGSEKGDVLLGKAGADYLFGWFGNDVIRGGKGQDLISGESGFDVLHGGSGADVFYFSFDLNEPPHTSFDTIHDFRHGKDHIGLSAYNANGQILPPGYLDKKYFHEGKKAVTTDHFVIYDKATGKLYADYDGAGGHSKFVFAKITPGTKLHADDFYVDDGIWAIPG